MLLEEGDVVLLLEKKMTNLSCGDFTLTNIMEAGK